MKNIGSLANIDASKGENGLKKWAKLPAKTVRNRGEQSFLADLATRIYEKRLLQLAIETQVGPTVNRREENHHVESIDGVEIQLKKPLMTLTTKDKVQENGQRTGGGSKCCEIEREELGRPCSCFLRTF